MRRYSIPLLMYLFCFFVSCRQDRPVRTWTIFSPDKRIRTTVVWHGTARRSASEDAEPTRLFYSVDYASDGLSMELIRPSPLGIRRQDGDFSESLAFRTGGDVKSIRESYDLVTGKRSSRTFHANEMVLDFKNADSARIQIVFRVYDDGVAFQYRFPDTTRDIRTVLSELTGFRLPDDGSGFLRSTLPGGAPAGGVVSMEKAFQNRNGWPLPALFKLHNGKAWVLLAEAGIDQRYGGSHLVPVNAKGSYVLRISDADESTVSPKSGPASRLPWSTPWRVVVAGNRLADIVESNLTTDLSRPHGMDDVRWIRPGRILWMGWQNGADPFDWGRHYAGIDLAGRMGWEYVLFDLSRGPSAVGGISDLVQYALERKVGILRHYPSVESAYHWICDAEKRRGEFARLRDSGVKGICVDFDGNDGPGSLLVLENVLHDAACFRLLVCFRGWAVPSGWSRTYPHLISMEDGRDFEKISGGTENPSDSPWTNTVLPFTRNAAGSLFRQAFSFSADTEGRKTTLGHELALSVLFESGWQFFSDNPENIRRLPPVTKRFLQILPTAWDDTRFLRGHPGNLVVIARRKGNAWFLGGISCENEVVEPSFNLDFLDNQPHRMIIIQDDGGAGGFREWEVAATAADSMRIPIPPRGGFVAYIAPSG